MNDHQSLMIVYRIMTDTDERKIVIAPLHLLLAASAVRRISGMVGDDLKRIMLQAADKMDAALIARHPDIQHADSPDDYLSAVTDRKTMDISLTYAEMWHIVAALQFLCRLPEIQPQRESFEDLGRQFQQAITESHPDSNELLEMGWHEEYDR